MKKHLFLIMHGFIDACNIIALFSIPFIFSMLEFNFRFTFAGFRVKTNVRLDKYTTM